MDATVTDISAMRKKQMELVAVRKRNWELYTQVRVRVPPPFSPFWLFLDPYIGKEGIVTYIQRVEEEGAYKGTVMYTIRFETPLGYASQSYPEKRLKFL